MKTAITFLAGVAAAWAALAIWQHRLSQGVELSPEQLADLGLPIRSGDRRPRFDDPSVDPLRGGCSGFGGGR